MIPVSTRLIFDTAIQIKINKKSYVHSVFSKFCLDFAENLKVEKIKLKMSMAKPQYDSVTKFAEIQNSLLQLERQEEIDRTKDLLLSSDSEKFSFKKAQELEKKGLGFRKVAILEWTTSAFGKNLITIGKQDQSELSASTFSNGE